MVYPEPAHYSY